MKGSKATEKMTEDWERGHLKVKSNMKINLRKKVETTSLILMPHEALLDAFLITHVRITSGQLLNLIAARLLFLN